ncbi:MAG: hypothetical protein WBN22_00445 [Verrucomicrobiia bacterium]
MIIQLLIGFVVPMLVTVVVTALFCRYRIARKKRVSYGTLFICPIIATAGVLLCLSVCFDGWRVFTRGYWTEGKGGLEMILVVFGIIAAFCVLPALGVAVYYQRRSKRDETNVV